jgi:hypothetical protein
MEMPWSVHNIIAFTDKAYSSREWQSELKKQVEVYRTLHVKRNVSEYLK